MEHWTSMFYAQILYKAGKAYWWQYSAILVPVLKYLTAVINFVLQKPYGLATAKHLHPSLIFAGKAEAYPSAASTILRVDFWA
jgi:hypothetical protein